MTAALFGARRERWSGPRPVDPRRDIASVAEVLDTAFTGHLDASGRRLVRNMRALGGLGWAGWLLARLFLPPAAYPQGFVWEEEGRLVGNASLLAVDGYPDRWVLANVAVLPEFRRRGIGRKLIEACLAWLGERGGKSVVLQVESDNGGAQFLYAALGFRPVTTRTTWIRRPGLPLLAPVSSPVRPRQGEEWRAQWALARRVHPEGLIWPYPLEVDLFRPAGLSGFLDRNSGNHWMWFEGDELQASLTARLGLADAGWRLILISAEQARGKVERAMLTRALAELRPASVRMSLDYPAWAAESDLHDLGFVPEHRLTWMALDLTQADRSP